MCKVITPVLETIWQSLSAWNEGVLVSLWEHIWQLLSKLSKELVKEMKLGFTCLSMPNKKILQKYILELPFLLSHL